MNRFIKLLLAFEAFLLFPIIGKLVSNEVNWSLFDFVLMFFMLAVLALVIELSLRLFKTFRQRLVAIVFILSLFVLTWIELAVGIFNSPFAGN